MARDYKHAAAPPPAGRASRVSTGGLGLIVGFAAGFATAVLLQVGVPGNKGATVTSQPGPQADKPPAQVATTEKPSPGDRKDSGGTTFDFYKMLPKFEVVIPEQDKDVRRSGEVSEIDKPGAYVLQVGSFQTQKDADRLRGELALLGIEADIQTVTIDRDQTWHRVRIGPVKSLERLNELRRRLADNEMQALVIKVGE
ncbi:MAG: SPOR domain-containing protein [Gammaproteobacteria bacterium]|nr:SPOR domain-containing protein [Gammaproteobacteria bacterium]